jgi:uncharacterized protein
MASGLSDDVDCARLAKDAVELEREYPLKDLPRLQDLLAESHGSMRARFAFSRLASGRPGALVAVAATPRLICQRCLQGFDFPVASDSAIEFANSEAQAPADSPHEIYVMRGGTVDLREVAEEELLLAIPFSAACTTPESCGRAPAFATTRIAGMATTLSETTGTATTGSATTRTETARTATTWTETNRTKSTGTATTWTETNRTKSTGTATTWTETNRTETTGTATTGPETTPDAPSRPFAGLKDLLKKT